MEAKQAGETTIIYRTEWLGYLPYGQYHWIECNGETLTLDLGQDWELSDLEQLERLGLLTKLSDTTAKDDHTDRAVVYEIREG